jgi:thymidylate synthase (FAD)
MNSSSNYPALNSKVARTPEGTPYLQLPGVVLLSKPELEAMPRHGLLDFLAGFGPELCFYDEEDSPLPAAERLAKFAGQLCYLSLGPGRTPDSQAQRYFQNILGSGHGSVLEHANFSFLFYGVSRSLTHELVRHRAGFAHSQASQRYIDGSKLRFVERPEFVADRELHELFIARIDRAATEYRLLVDMLTPRQADASKLSRADIRKQVNQVARCLLPNETEAPIVVTANARAWRHFLQMRGSLHAESEIRNLAVGIYQVLASPGVAPLLFQDFGVERQGDTTVVTSRYQKV